MPDQLHPVLDQRRARVRIVVGDLGEIAPHGELARIGRIDRARRAQLAIGVAPEPLRMLRDQHRILGRVIDHEVHHHGDAPLRRGPGEALEQPLRVGAVRREQGVQAIVVLDRVQAAGEAGIVERVDEDPVEAPSRRCARGDRTTAAPARPAAGTDCRCGVLASASRPPVAGTLADCAPLTTAAVENPAAAARLRRPCRRPEVAGTSRLRLVWIGCWSSRRRQVPEPALRQGPAACVAASRPPAVRKKSHASGDARRAPSPCAALGPRKRGGQGEQGPPQRPQADPPARSARVCCPARRPLLRAAPGWSDRPGRPAQNRTPIFRPPQRMPSSHSGWRNW